MRGNRDSLRYGKKIGDLRLGPEGQATQLLPYRFNDSTMQFAVQVGDDWITGSSLAIVKKEAQEALNKLHKLVFRPFIKFSLTADESSGRRSYYQTEGEIENDEDFAGLRLTFSVVELSDLIPTKKENQFSDSHHRLGREMRPDDQGVLHPWPSNAKHERMPFDNDEVIPYTPEAYAALVGIHKSLLELYRKLRAVLSPDDKKLAAKNLIALGEGGIEDIPALPPRPEPEPESPKKKRPRARADQPADVVAENGYGDVEEGDL